MQSANANLLAFQEEAANLYKLAMAHDRERADLRRRTQEVRVRRLRYRLTSFKKHKQRTKQLEFELSKAKTREQVAEIQHAKALANMAEKLTLW